MIQTCRRKIVQHVLIIFAFVCNQTFSHELVCVDGNLVQAYILCSSLNNQPDNRYMI